MNALLNLILAALTAGAGYYMHKKTVRELSGNYESSLRLYAAAAILGLGLYNTYKQLNLYGQAAIDEGNFVVVGTMFVAMFAAAYGFCAMLVSMHLLHKRDRALAKIEASEHTNA